MYVLHEILELETPSTALISNDFIWILGLLGVFLDWQTNTGGL